MSLYPCLWTFVSRFSITAAGLSWGTPDCYFILFFPSWDSITSDSLLDDDHSLTHHNTLSFKADSEIHFLPLLTFAGGNYVSCNTTHWHCFTWSMLCSWKTRVCPTIDISSILVIKKQTNHAHGTLLNLWYNEQKLLTASEIAPSANNCIFLLH